MSGKANDFHDLEVDAFFSYQYGINDINYGRVIEKTDDKITKIILADGTLVEGEEAIDKLKANDEAQGNFTYEPVASNEMKKIIEANKENFSENFVKDATDPEEDLDEVEVSSDNIVLPPDDSFIFDGNNPYHRFIANLVNLKVKGDIAVIPQTEALLQTEIEAQNDAEAQAEALKAIKENLNLPKEMPDEHINIFFCVIPSSPGHYTIKFMSKDFLEAKSLLKDKANWPIDGDKHPQPSPEQDTEFRSDLYKIGTALIFRTNRQFFQEAIPLDDIENVDFGTKQFTVDQKKQDLPFMSVKIKEDNKESEIEFSPVKAIMRDGTDASIQKMVTNLFQNSGWKDFKVGKADGTGPFKDKELKVALAFLDIGESAGVKNILDEHTMGRLKETLAGMSPEEKQKIDAWQEKFKVDYLKLPPSPGPGGKREKINTQDPNPGGG